MSIVRIALLASLAASILSACSSYKQVDDPSDGDNGKYKNRPVSLVR